MMKKIFTVILMSCVTGCGLGGPLTNSIGLFETETSWCWTNSMDGSLMDQKGKYLIAPSRVQLSAKISGELKTNWTTTSITSPVISKSEQFDAVYRPPMLNQSGQICSNTLATIVWHGKPVIVILETVELGSVTRSIPASASTMGFK